MDSTRLPGKMLLDVGGVPLVIRTALQAKKSSALSVVVATDDIDIFKVCETYKINAVMTNINHQSGTERIAEVVSKLGYNDNEYIVNVQGDEPLIDHMLIDNLSEFIINKKTQIATITHNITSTDEINNPNIVKVVLDKNSNALYFSRYAIPYNRDNDTLDINRNIYLRHIGIYAYTVGFLKEYVKMSVSKIEQIEKLEQLRILYHGYDIAVMKTDIVPHAGVDTMDDLVHVRSFYSKSLV